MKYQKRQASQEDFPHIWELIVDGKKQMNACGITQWNDNYPSQDLIHENIKNKQLWIYGSHNEAIVTFFKENKVGFIQRLVVSSKHKREGIAEYILTDLIEQEKKAGEITELKISTNHTNLIMCNLLAKLNFIPCKEYIVSKREDYGLFIEFCYQIRISK